MFPIIGLCKYHPWCLQEQIQSLAKEAADAKTALLASQQAHAALQNLLQQQTAEAAAARAAAAQATGEAHAHAGQLKERVSKLQQELQTSQQREQEARAEIKQLAGALSAAHEEHQVG